MNRQQLIAQIHKKESYLCVGLDTDIKKIPSFLLKEKDPIFEFNKRIIDATHEFAVAYKPNIAFYEALGSKGWESLEKTIEYIPDELFTIADAKRGDIGNTSSLYARAFFEHMNFDSITVAPYMGEDSVKPFLEFEGKWTIALGLTSNEGSKDFQQLICASNPEEMLYMKVLKTIASWGTEDNLMFVIGATKASLFSTIRNVLPNHFLLVPGIGAQGGDLGEVSKHGLTDDGGLLVNSSRGIIYASSGDDFAKEAAKEAKKIQLEMSTYLAKRN